MNNIKTLAVNTELFQGRIVTVTPDTQVDIPPVAPHENDLDALILRLDTMMQKELKARQDHNVLRLNPVNYAPVAPREIEQPAYVSLGIRQAQAIAEEKKRADEVRQHRIDQYVRIAALCTPTRNEITGRNYNEW